MQTYEFRQNHTDNCTTAYYSSGSYHTALEEWFGRSLSDFARGMEGRGFSYHKDESDIAGRRWTSHYWTK